MLWPPDAKSQLIGNDPDARKDCRQEEKDVTVGEMFGYIGFNVQKELGCHLLSFRS